MEMTLNKFKRAIQQRELQIGLWSHLSNHVSTEVIGGSGFDWIVLDAEHSPNETFLLHQQLQALTEGGSHPVVRLAWNDKVLIKRVLDIGVQTLLVPYVQTAEEARAAVAATRYPGAGTRGFTGLSRASRFGRIKDYHARAQDEICVLVQVETAEALDNLEAIAAVEGVDGVFIGPGDLSAAMGYLNNPAHPDMQRIFQQTVARIIATGKPAGILTGDENLARQYIEWGCTFTAVGADIALLARASEQLAARFQQVKATRVKAA
ncbi:HpcH/HpaI aldolase/citrate lyase family protein [Uliginosibacterium sp. H1]|uniref:HpcH/HpaI aldolase/citrate lyase family protein n=1 Tax=Uliginosibacterium sp. H1 TaxID=3114757 RepID=UPI002E19112F|nr:HpcH/HpaI aldolase/citrate lyase family protein [Uliginosibacterium sp. H1]